MPRLAVPRYPWPAAEAGGRAVPRLDAPLSSTEGARPTESGLAGSAMHAVPAQGAELRRAAGDGRLGVQA